LNLQNCGRMWVWSRERERERAKGKRERAKGKRERNYFTWFSSAIDSYIRICRYITVEHLCQRLFCLSCFRHRVVLEDFVYNRCAWPSYSLLRYSMFKTIISARKEKKEWKKEVYTVNIFHIGAEKHIFLQTKKIMYIDLLVNFILGK
jgi:hypothetical protein